MDQGRLKAYHRMWEAKPGEEGGYNLMAGIDTLEAKKRQDRLDN